MQSLAALMQSYSEAKGLTELEGIHQTLIPGLKFYRASQSSARQPLLYQSGIIVMGQGHKKIYIADNAVTYGPGDYLVLGVPMPLECEAFAEQGLPILGLVIDISSTTLHKLVNQIDEQRQQHRQVVAGEKAPLDFGIKANSIDKEINRVLVRIVNVLHQDVDASILGPAMMEELVYRVLMGRNGHILYDLAHHDGHYARIARVLDTLHQQYPETISVEQLAQQAHMSVSGFHRAFRQVTNETPLQYLKKVRLNKAKELIISAGKTANEVAMLVGYASASQFSREFKRHFNATPKGIVHSI